MNYAAKNYDHLLGLAGMSDQLLKNHFTLYQGYVKNVNETTDKRRFGWEFNGMRLHELFFQNLKVGGAGSVPDEIAPLLDEFKATGAMRGIGWTVLYFDPVGEKLITCWINEHDVGHLAGCLPILVMDVFEHAYMIDYGLKRADYIEAFMKVIDWEVVAARLAQAKSFTP
jgi:Fe-Mn family superoxide dismutase